ncbi:DNA cytosine methyltransferase [Desulfoluna butyratoxydans]|uniref:DNA (cytosine-5-)-methyltransferase n=1 Tax=Desulfoluna butyratoxydans TaxID=231438 RepID=A0A4U8YRB8_9BACT|nr:DNA cytosine methyltransferase [Desulfoluna butyratoxydans]VFQ46895.1 s-adenosyl-l-methionine-dependent methyltransferase [Desulfoluna butyratoxydans]
MSKIAVFDFFCGCGGTSAGFRSAGLDIAFALDVDKDAANTYRHNFPDTYFHEGDIRDLKKDKLEEQLTRFSNHLTLFCACAPCQPYSKQRTEKKFKDERLGLLELFIPLIKKYQPDFVFIENVPGLHKGRDGLDPLGKLTKVLKKYGYKMDSGVVAAQDYGAPQLRRRFVLLASRHGQINIPAATHGIDSDNPFKTVRDAIDDLPAIAAGETYKGISLKNHRAAALSELNLKRIKASSPDGGGRYEWHKSLWPACYTRTNDKGDVHSGHTDCYGRLWWDKPAPGLTTRCISYSNGRFGHPEQNRAISVREAARLQGFSDDFEFNGTLNSMAKQIGNAVPVDLALAMGRQFIQHIEGINGKV